MMFRKYESSLNTWLVIGIVSVVLAIGGYALQNTTFIASSLISGLVFLFSGYITMYLSSEGSIWKSALVVIPYAIITTAAEVATETINQWVQLIPVGIGYYLLVVFTTFLITKIQEDHRVEKTSEHKYESSFNVWLVVGVVTILIIVVSFLVNESGSFILLLLILLAGGSTIIYFSNDKNIWKAGVPGFVIMIIEAFNSVSEYDPSINWVELIFTAAFMHALISFGAFLFLKLQKDQKRHQGRKPSERKYPENAKPWKVSKEAQKYEIDHDKYNEAIKNLDANNMKLSDLTEEEQQEFWEDVKA